MNTTLYVYCKLCCCSTCIVQVIFHWTALVLQAFIYVLTNYTVFYHNCEWFHAWVSISWLQMMSLCATTSMSDFMSAYLSDRMVRRLLSFHFRDTFQQNSEIIICNTWWRHQMETLSALLAICAGNSPVTGHDDLIYWFEQCGSNSVLRDPKICTLSCKLYFISQRWNTCRSFSQAFWHPGVGLKYTC